MDVKLFEKSYSIIYGTYSLNDLSQKYDGHSEYDIYLNEIKNCQSDDIKEALIIINTAKGVAKKTLQNNLKYSLKRFETYSDRLTYLWEYEEVKDLYREFFVQIKKLFGIKIEIKGEYVTEYEDRRGNPNFKKKKLSSEVLFSIINKANELIEKNPDLYTPKPGKKTNTALTIEIFQYLEKKYKIDRINSYFRKEITLFGDRFWLHPPSDHTNSKKIVVY